MNNCLIRQIEKRNIWPLCAIRTAVSLALAVALATGSALPANILSASQAEPTTARMARLDLRLATIGYRLAVSNASLCTKQMSATGLVVHAIEQYPRELEQDLRARFVFALPLSVEAVVPGSPAEFAGVRAGDGLVALAGMAVPDHPLPPGSARRDAFENALTGQPFDRPLAMRVLRADDLQDLTMAANPACRARFEVVFDKGGLASSNGHLIQINQKLVDSLDNEFIAAIVAHELAHSILDHRRRLDSAEVKSGLLAQFGRSRRIRNQAEREADRLSVYLLRNGGYPPDAGIRFWLGPGKTLAPGLLRSRFNDSPNHRARLMQQEIAVLPPNGPKVIVPAMLDAARFEFD